MKLPRPSEEFTNGNETETVGWLLVANCIPVRHFETQKKGGNIKNALSRIQIQLIGPPAYTCTGFNGMELTTKVQRPAKTV